jgi:integrase
MKRLKRELMRKFPGGHWNNKVTLRAAIAYWCRRKRLHMANPVDVVDWEKPRNARKERIPFDGHRKAVAVGSRLQPAWLPVFLECGWETGWRSGEIQDWRVERLHLDPEGEDFPWVLTLIEKQGQEAPVYEEKPFSFRLGALLKAYLKGRTEGPVWPLGRTATDRWWRRAFDEAGLAGKRFHDYRRSIKKRLEDAGVSDEWAAEYAGHDEDVHKDYKRAGRARQDFHPLLRKLEPGHIRDTERANG